MDDWTMPSPTMLRLATHWLKPWKLLARPVFFGLDRIPEDRPLLFVGNHTLYGVLDVPFMIMQLYETHGIWLRGLGDFIHFQIPWWGQLLRYFGVVPGTRASCDLLMKRGECIAVFPGGARETSRLKGERYTLDWRERLGFAQMAVENRCTIVPFSAIGVDDAFTLWLDRTDLMNIKPLAAVIRRFSERPDMIWPIPKAFRPERMYFHFGEPIHTDSYDGDASRDHVVAIRDRTQTAVLQGIDFLLNVRQNDADRRLSDWAVRALGGRDAAHSVLCHRSDEA